MHAVRATGLLALLVLGACAAKPPAPVVEAGPPPGIDGRYRGTVRLVTSNHPRCPRSGPRVLDIENGTVTVAYSGTARSRTTVPPRVPLTARIGSDGHFQTSDGIGTLDGQLSGGTLEFTIASSTCEHRWTLRQVN